MPVSVFRDQTQLACPTCNACGKRIERSAVIRIGREHAGTTNQSLCDECLDELVEQALDVLNPDLLRPPKSDLTPP